MDHVRLYPTRLKPEGSFEGKRNPRDIVADPDCLIPFGAGEARISPDVFHELGTAAADPRGGSPRTVSLVAPSWRWDGGIDVKLARRAIDVKLGDPLNGYDAKGKVRSMAEAAVWLRDPSLPALPGQRVRPQVRRLRLIREHEK
jgi:hypothetical protein